MATIKVKVGPGLKKFPMPGQAQVKRYITDEPVLVESSAYYRRALADGDLILVTDQAPAVSAAKGQNGGQNSAKAAVPTQDKTDKKAATDE